MIHVANILIYGGLAGLVGLLFGVWWGVLVGCVAAMATGAGVLRDTIGDDKR